MNSPFIEGVKEMLRVVLLGVVSILLVNGVVAKIVSMTGVNLTTEQTAIIVGGLTSFLRMVDKWLHEWGKENAGRRGITFEWGEFVKKGLTRF